MSKKYNVILHEEFQISLFQCLNHLKKFNYAYAQRIKADVYQSLRVLEVFPNMFSVFKNPYSNNVYRRMVVDTYNLVIYRVNNSFVHIVFFVDGRQAYHKYYNSLK